MANEARTAHRMAKRIIGAKKHGARVTGRVTTNRAGTVELVDYVTDDPVIRSIGAHIEQHPYDNAAYLDMLMMYEVHLSRGEKRYHQANKSLRSRIVQIMNRLGEEKRFDLVPEFNRLYRKSLKMDARTDFDSFMLYMELNRAPNERFYLPRRKVLRPIVKAFQEVQDGEIDLLTVSQPKRTGKAVPVDTMVLTPGGYVRIGDLKIGDTVTAVDGRPTQVTGVYPQGRKQVYRVTFGETGKCRESTTVECCGEHLWTVQTEEDRHSGMHRVMSTEELMRGTMRRGHDRHRNYSVDYVGPVQFDMRGEMLIKPYTMGVLIAEGGFTGGSIRVSMGDEQTISRVEHELSDRLKYVGKYDYAIVGNEKRRDAQGHPVKSFTGQALVRYGLWEKHAWEKHIPEEYLYAPIEDRIELIRGLFDSDGSVVSNGCEYSTTSEQLAKDVCFLVRSLGGRCRITSRMGCYAADGKRKETRINYRVFCKLPGTINPFYIHRKAEKCNSRMKKLHHFIESIEVTDEYREMVCISVADESKQYIIGDSMIPTHNTTVGTWFVLFRAGQHPNSSSFCCGSGDTLVKSFYNGMLEVLRDNEKYLFHEIFPEAPLVQTNSEEKTINLKDITRFATVTCRSIDGAITGSTEATPDGVLYIDDMVANEEEAINAARLEFLWNKVTGDLMGRRLEGCPIVAQGTRYSLYDPIGHLQEEAHNMGWRSRIVEIPALDPVTDESNFEIEIAGRKLFTSEFYRHERALVTDVQWESQFQQNPIEKKGRLYEGDKLRRYFELPQGEPDAKIAICDTKDKGTDYAFLPVAYQYGDDYFIVDCICDNGMPQYVRERLALILAKHKVQLCRFESNSAGGVTAEIVANRVRELGGVASITTMFSTAQKETRILVNSPWVMEHCLFKDKSKYTASEEYGVMMRFLTGYTVSGKNQHDDVPDGMAMLAQFAQSLIVKKVEVFRRPW